MNVLPLLPLKTIEIDLIPIEVKGSLSTELHKSRPIPILMINTVIAMMEGTPLVVNLCKII